MGVPKFPKLGFLWIWDRITLCADLWLRWGLKQSYSSCQDISNNMWHVTYMQGNWGDYWLLVVGSQTVNLTPGLSFDHNLCFRCSNGSCEPILDIYVSIFFNDINNSSIQWVLAPAIALWRFRSPLGLQLPKWEFTWECEGSPPHTLCTPGNMRCEPRASLLAHNLPSPCFGHEPKGKVMTRIFLNQGVHELMIVHTNLKFAILFGNNDYWGQPLG